MTCTTEIETGDVTDRWKALIRSGRTALRVGTLIKDRMERMALNQTQFAAKVGVSQGTVSHWISGRMLPHDDNATQLCFVLAIEPSEYYKAWSEDRTQQVKTLWEARGGVVAVDADVIDMARSIATLTDEQRAAVAGFICSVADLDDAKCAFTDSVINGLAGGAHA